MRDDLARVLGSPGPDLLAAHVFTIAPDGPECPIPLAALLARLLAGPEVQAFPHVAAEQHGYWWRFLVRCAVRALRSLELDVGAAVRNQPDELAPAIERVLRSAAPEGAWLLYQPDPNRAGFLQPPCVGGSLDRYRENSASMLTGAIGSKNHERKIDVARELTAEQVVYALIEYQIGAIFGGRGNYGSQLLGSAAGAGSGTPFMGVRLGEELNETFRHDVGVFLSGWEEIRAIHKIQGATWALWGEPWDGQSQLPATSLDPAFIPLARLVRLAPPEGGRFRTVWFRASEKARVLDHTDGSGLGDIFAPLVPNPKSGAPKVRGALARGYDYPEVVRLLFGAGKGGGTPSPSVAALKDLRHDARGNVRVILEGVAYEQGKTLGFHRREVLMPLSGLGSFLADPAPVRAAHEKMFAKVAEAKSALRGASRILLAGTPRPRDGDAAKIETPAAAFEAAVDQVYIRELLDSAERESRGDDAYQRDWAEKLSRMAKEAFLRNMASVPTAAARRLEREVRAEAYLAWKLRELRGETGEPRPADRSPEAETEEEEVPA